MHSVYLASGFVSPIPRTRFQISGADRTRYLNSQLTNDLRKSIPNSALPCCLLTPKGKMCALVWVFEQGDAWIIDTDFEVRTAVQDRLDRYLVADDVRIDDVSETGILFHLFGQSAFSLPWAEGIQTSRLGVPGIDLWIPKDQTEHFHKKLMDLEILEATHQYSEPYRIAAGIPAWGAELSEDSLPAEVGLDRWAIDFAKGCYVGQEVVSRIRSVGRVNRRLVGFIAENLMEPLSPAAKIIDPVSKACVGSLTSVAFHFKLSRTIALGYLKIGFVSSTASFLAIESGKETPIRTFEFPLSLRK